MKTNLLKIILLLFLGFLSGISLVAQPQASIYTDLGRSVVYDGLFVKNAGLFNYQFGQYKPEVGFQFEIRNAGDYFLSGYAFKLSRDFLLRNFGFKLQGFYIVTPSPSLLRETNWGIVSKIEYKHFIMHIGTTFRTFAYTGKAIREYEIQTNTKIHEIWNLIYSFDYYVQPLNHPWNIAMSVTNLDYFTIEHETIPILSLQTLYGLNPRLRVFVEARCKGNVPFNFNMNYFGFALRTGIIFNI